MGCSVSTTTDPVIINELKRSRHSRRRQSMDSKFIEERHPTPRNDTPGGISGRTTSTAFSHETASASSGGTVVRYPVFPPSFVNARSSRVNSEPNTESSNRPLPASIARRQSEIAFQPVPGTSEQQPRRRLPSAASQTESFVHVQRRVVVAWEAPPSLSPIRQQRRRRHDRLSRASSCTWPSASSSATFGTETFSGILMPPNEHTPITSNNNRTPNSNGESVATSSLRTNSTISDFSQVTGSKFNSKNTNFEAKNTRQSTDVSDTSQKLASTSFHLAFTFQSDLKIDISDSAESNFALRFRRLNLITNYFRRKSRKFSNAVIISSGGKSEEIIFLTSINYFSVKTDDLLSTYFDQEINFFQQLNRDYIFRWARFYIMIIVFVIFKLL